MADNISVKDSAGAATTVRTTDTAGVHTPHHIVESSALPTGAATAAHQATEQGLVGELTEAAPANDTASSGLNGRLQRIAQRLTSLIALLPAALGAGGGLKVDGSGTPLPVSGTVTVGGSALLEATTSADTDGTATEPVGRGSTSVALPVEVQDSSGAELFTASNPGQVTLSTALSRLLDAVAVAQQTDALMQGGTALTPAFAIIDAASSGDNTLLAAQGAGNKITVHSLYLVASAAVTVRFESGAGGTALSGQMQLAANGGFVLPFNPVGWFETAANTLLNLELSGATSVDGGFQYTVRT